MKTNLVMAVTLGGLIGAICAFNAVGHESASGSNVYRADSRLPSKVRRIAVLPVTADPADLATEDGREILASLPYTELCKRGLADVIVVTPEELRSWTGQKEWTAAQALPQDFLQRLHKATGCDAVVFSQLIYYRAYPPLGVGWKMQLVDVQGRVLWAVDAVFDAGRPAVADAARGYHHQCFRGPMDDADIILLSPRRFGQYATAAALETMPPR
jgi:hypothetical protein